MLSPLMGSQRTFLHPQGWCLPVFTLLEPNSYYLNQTLWFWRPFCWRQGGKKCVCCVHAQVPPGPSVHPWSICSSYRYPHCGCMVSYANLRGQADEKLHAKRLSRAESSVATAFLGAWHERSSCPSTKSLPQTVSCKRSLRHRGKGS